jgi:hypothetical protein
MILPDPSPETARIDREIAHLIPDLLPCRHERLGEGLRLCAAGDLLTLHEPGHNLDSDRSAGS